MVFTKIGHRDSEIACNTLRLRLSAAWVINCPTAAREFRFISANFIDGLARLTGYAGCECVLATLRLFRLGWRTAIGFRALRTIVSDGYFCLACQTAHCRHLATVFGFNFG
tara:strand:- start:910 stop:1242 length:333 start_codon:yes stop_codon:yes gene_type:complete